MPTPTTQKYYPSLSTVVSLDDFPDSLGFIKDGIQQIFDKIYIKDFQASISPRGESGFYGLSIVSKKRLQFQIPGTEMFLILNPDNTDSSISSFPVTVEYQWLILSYLRSFNLQNFSYSPREFFELGLQILNVSEEEVVTLIINNFVSPKSETLTKVEQFVNDVNTQFGLNIPVPTSDNKTRELVLAIKNQFSDEASIAAFLLYLLDESSLSNSISNVKNFFKNLIPDDIDSYIKNIITPKARVTLELSAAIEFPNSYLKPVTSEGEPYVDPSNPNPKSQFRFAQALFHADTQEGIGYQFELGGSLSPSKYAMIGNTGMILELDTLKLDLSKKTNIPEATADGRPNDFVGVYARAVSVTLPSKWFHDYEKEGQGSTSTTLRIGASDLLIGTGGISGDIYLETVPISTGIFSYFDDKFDFDYPLSMFVKNEETDVVEIKLIKDYNELLDYLQEFRATSSLPYPFSYPLKLTTKDTLVSQNVPPSTAYSFKNAKEYQAFLSKLTDSNTLWKKIGNADRGFEVGLNKFDISFKQNKVIGSNIKGALEIPKFKNGENAFKVDLEGHLQDDGDFNLTASFPNENKPKANLFDLVQLDFNSFELGKEDEDFYIGTSCHISFPQGSLIGNLMKGQGFDVEKLRIYSDGNIEVEGGSIPIPISLSVNLGPVQMAVTNISFGSTQINGRKYNFWGFDGAISINPLGVDARGEGVKFYYPTDGDDDEDRKAKSFLRIQTIEVDLIIPGTATEASAMAIINGMVSLPEPGKSQEFIGEVSLKLPKAKISGGVGMRFMPKYPAFLIDAHIELPTPIPLGFLAISAFRGLLGFRYVATKEAAGLKKDNSWYEFYKTPKPGINIRKFSGPPDSMQYNSPFSIGAGATFGTVADGGHVLSLRAMLLLSLPTLFYIEAGLNVIAGKLGLIEDDPSNPPFFAMVAFGDDSLELAAGADFSIPKDSGQIFKLHALLEAGFFFKNQKPWYVNIGSRKDPITAEILTLFTAKAFIMLSAQGIEAGARLDFKLQQSFGPAKVKLWAYLELGGKISFKRPQMGGYIMAGGGIQIKLWIINVEIVLDTIFSVESFKPFLIYAKLELSVRVKIAFVKVRKNFVVELQWDINRVVDRTPYSPLPMGTHGDGEDNRTLENVKGVHMLTNEAFALDYFDVVPDGNEITQIIPLDTYIDIKMAKGVLPNPELSQKIGGYTGDAKNYTDMMPPVSTQAGRKLRQVKHQYAIKSIGIKSWNGSAWEDYHPFEAVKDIDTNEDLSTLPWAQWQKAIDQYDSIRVLGTNPFSFLSAAEPGWHVPEQFGITSSRLFCVSPQLESEHTDFLNKQIGQRYYVPSQYEADKINGLFFKLIGDLSEVTEDNTIEGTDFMSISGETNPHGFNKSLSFKNNNQLEVIFPESAIEPTFQITTQAKEVLIKAFTAVTEDNSKFISYEPIKLRKTVNDDAEYDLTYTKTELLSSIKLLSEETEAISKTKISKIVIIPLSPNAKRIYEIRNEIAALFTETYSTETGEVSISLPGSMTEYNALLAELAILKAEAGNDNPSAEMPGKLTFTNYYGYKGKDTYAFEKVIKFNDTYIITFHPKADKTVLLQVDSKGAILRERLLNGVVTSMQVANDKLLVTQSLNANQCKGIGEAIIDLDFIVGCESPIAAMAVSELDNELNLSSGVQYLNSYSLGFNKVLSLANNELLWINALETETQINWINGTDRALIKCAKINANAIKVLQHSGTEFSLITKDKKIIYFNLNTSTNAISVTDTKVISDASVSEIIDAVIANGKILVTVKFSDGKFGLAQITGNSLDIVKQDAVFDSAIYLSNNTLTDNSTLAYNEKYLFVFGSALTLTRLIKRNNELENASIIHIQNEPSENEILMLSSQPKEKGVYFSLFTDQFDNCSLHPGETVTITTSASALTTEMTSLTTTGLAANVVYTRAPKNSKLISVNEMICSNGNSEEDPELGYTTSVQRIDWLSKEDYFHNSTIPQEDAVEDDREAMKAAVEKTIQPIWRPNTTYCLDFTLTDTVDDDRTTDFNYFYGFKTLGPVGHYPVPDKPVNPNEQLPVKNELTELSKSPLTSLRQYLDYNRSYPNADGSLLQSKPAFYGNQQCKVSLFFTNPYAYHMFKDWGPYNEDKVPEIKGKLNLFIKDPLTDLLIEYPFKNEEIAYPKPNEEVLEWKDDNDPRIPLGIQLINNILTDKSAMRCTLDWGDPIKPKSYRYEVELTNLKPSKLYTVLVNNFFDDAQHGTTSLSKNILVHQFGFQTSKYENFEEQIQSYYLNEDQSHSALYDVNLNLVQEQIDAFFDVIANQQNDLNDALVTKYQHSFDRVIEGILKMSPLDPAQNTEVNKIIDSNTGNVIALLVRNPEPFNIPKMPLEEIKDSIVVVDAFGHTKADYKVLHSKDYSQALIVHNSKMISEENLTIQFDYRMWKNGGTELTESIDKQTIEVQLSELENTNL